MIDKNLLRQLPAIENLLNTQEMLDLQDTYARPLVTEALRTVVADVRGSILSGNLTRLPEHTEYVEQTRQKIVEKIGARMHPVVNANRHGYTHQSRQIAVKHGCL